MNPCPRSEIEIIGTFWILRWSVRQVLFKDTDDTSLWVLKVLKGLGSFGFVMQTLDPSLIIFRVILHILQITMVGLWINFYFQLRVSTDYQVFVFITSMESKVHTDEV